MCVELGDGTNNVGGALERLLLAEWGRPILDGLPDLSTHELLATEEGAV